MSGNDTRPGRKTGPSARYLHAASRYPREGYPGLTKAMKGHRTELSAFSRSYETPYTFSDFESSHPYGIVHCPACDVEMRFHHLRRRQFLELLCGRTVFLPAAPLVQKKDPTTGFLRGVIAA